MRDQCSLDRLEDLFDPDQIITFLRWLPHAERETLVFISRSGRVRARTYARDQEQEIVRDIIATRGTNNIYFHVNELKVEAHNTKARKADIARVRMLHADIDDAGAGDRIARFVPRPSLVVRSGGGFHTYWFLDKPTTDFDRVERLNKALADALGGDHCQNVDRLLRVPGTPNIPNKKKRKAGRVVVMARIDEELSR